MTGRLRVLLIAAVGLALGGVGVAISSSSGDGHTNLTQAVATTVRTSTSSTSSTTTSATSTSTTSTTARPAPVATTTTTRVHPPRVIVEQDWTPFATVGGVTLHHPSRRVERIGFHESSNDGSRVLEALPTATNPVTLESRGRDNPPRTAADVVSDPDVEIRSPVSGRVLRSGTYTLYCKDTDSFLVVEPDDHPGWEVKLLHIDGVLVHPGDVVVAGETVVSPRPHRLPFESQVEEYSASPPWPHVHIEVDDPSIKDRPGPGC